MNVTATGIEGVILINDGWDALALAVTFDGTDEEATIRARFAAAAQAAVEINDALRPDAIGDNVILFPVAAAAEPATARR